MPPRGRRAPVTLDDVAALAGVSRTTASRVMSGSPQVRPDTRRSVERAAAKLGYVPNRAARSLVTGRTGTVGLVLARSASTVSAPSLLTDLAYHVNRALAGTDIQLVLFLVEEPEDHERLLRHAASGYIDGALVFPPCHDDRLVERLREADVPFVLGGRSPAPDRVQAYVDFDNVHGAMAAVQHLLSCGRRRIGVLAGPEDHPAVVDRLAGYRKALAGAGRVDEELVVRAGGELGSSETAMHELLRRCPDLDAVLTTTDLLVVGAMRVLRATGRRVPQDVAVVAFDDGGMLALLEPGLTRVTQRLDLMAREMVRLLLDQLAGERTARVAVVLEPELVVGRTT